ncbi:MAG: hypothetical protein ACI9Z3_000829 [Roseivirga sp.]|jgi:hypothetical protein
MAKFTLFIILLFTFSIQVSVAQIGDVTDKLELYSQNFIEEKIYLHTDRAHYGQGELIWFQSYLVLGSFYEPSVLSSAIYVQLYNVKDSLIREEVIRSENGFGQGHLQLENNIPPGPYRIVAFTNWMRNFGEDRFFNKNILVLGEQENEPKRIDLLDDKIDLQFFPEGGELIAGIPTKVAFKATNALGQGVDIKGQISMPDGNDITFVSEHNGMGSFFMIPNSETSYNAQIIGLSTPYPLPAVKNEGAALRVYQVDKTKLKVTAIHQLSSKSEKPFQLLIHKNGVPFFTANINFKGSISITEIPTEIITSGIINITLFDPENNPVSERLVFIENDNDNLILQSDRDVYQTRDKVKINLQLLDDKQDSLQGVFSLSAIDLGQAVAGEPEINIYTELLLNSELKGNIEDPNYYFDKKNENRTAHLDLVMLSHGWRRFTWKNILNSEYPEIDFRIENGITVKGNVLKDSFKSKTEASAQVFLFGKDPNNKTFLQAETDENGNFVFEDLNIYKDEEILLKGTRGKKDKTNVTINVDSSAQSIKLPKYYLSTAKVPQKAKFIEAKIIRDKIDTAFAYLYDSSVRILESFVVEGSFSRAEIEEEELKKTAFGKGNDAINFDDPLFSGQADPIGALRGKFPGVTITGTLGSYNISIRQTGRLNPSPPFFLLNDVPVSIDLITSLNVSQVERVVLFKGLSASAMFGQDGVGGVLAFYTNTDIKSKNNSEDQKGLFVAKIPNALQRIREFYAPKYDVKKPDHIKPDRRILIHWQPMINVETNKSAEIEFYTSDLATNIMINVQGISLTGVPYSKSITIETKKN